MAKPSLSIAMWSDIACPWCYVGKKKLDAALAQVKAKAAPTIEWRAYLLDPSFPPAGEPIDAYGLRRFGPGFAAMKQRVEASGRAAGAPFADWKWRASTLKAHMLVALARERGGKDHQAAELLFRATYEEGANISDTAVLLDVAAQLGLRQEAQKALGAPAGPGAGADGSSNGTAASAGGAGPQAGGEEGGSCGLDGVCAGSAGHAGPAGDEDTGLDGELLRAVEMDDALAKSRMRVTGVPFFLISAERPGGGSSRRVALSGAQPVEVFLEAFEQALAEAAA